MIRLFAMRQKLNDYESLSNATTIDSALNYIRTKQQRQERKKQLPSLDSTSDDNGGDDSSDSQSQITADTEADTAASGKQTVF